MNALVSVLLLATATLSPTKLWFAPGKPVAIEVKPAGTESTLVLSDFAGKIYEVKGSADVAADKTVDLREMFQEVNSPGTYVLYLVKKGAAKDLQTTPTDFLGTPLVIEVRQDTRPGSPPGPMVTHVTPLRYALMNTNAGKITMAFYYDVAGNTADTFLRLSEEGFFDGLTFHRVVHNFVIQGGDPRGDGTGGPGFTIPAEFNARPHKEGVLSMARNGDPAEGGGVMPRAQYADSASSQFFICLDYRATQQLDGRYTAFGEVTDGMDVVKKIGSTQTGAGDRPTETQTIDKVEVKPVTAAENPYAKMSKAVAAPPKGKF
jgi:cyclophilin family peptidyl-prolyl cis-trans isomerase